MNIYVKEFSIWFTYIPTPLVLDIYSLHSFFKKLDYANISRILQNILYLIFSSMITYIMPWKFVIRLRCVIREYVDE